MKRLYSELNAEQYQAVIHNEGPCLVLSGPGSGKTTVITNRVLNLIKEYKVNPQNILVVTFSRAAADEMKERFIKLSNKKYEGVVFGTFHSVFFRLLSRYKAYKLENLIDDQGKLEIIRSIIRRSSLPISEEYEEISDIINEIGYIKNTFSSIMHYEPKSCKKEIFDYIYEHYEKIKESYHKFDYDDMLIHCYDMLISNENALKETRKQYKYVLVDEFQDINTVQFETLKLLTKPNNNIFVVGDDDQSIYSFRGASPEIILQFPSIYNKAKTITLTRNYRSSVSIINASTKIIKNNLKRFDKNVQAVKDINERPMIRHLEDFEAEADFIASHIKNVVCNNLKYSDIAVIYRTNIQSRTIVDSFVCNNIPFIASDGLISLYNHWVYLDILSYLRLAIQYDKNDMIRIINKPKRYIRKDLIQKNINKPGNLIDNLVGEEVLNNLQVNALFDLKKSINRMSDMNAYDAIMFIRSVIGYDEYLREYSANKGIDSSGLIETAEEMHASSRKFSCINDFIAYVSDTKNRYLKENKDKKAEKVQLLTMHKAKGLEFEKVFIVGCVDSLIPYARPDDDTEKIEEERRLLYVAMTRAKSSLILTVPKFRYGKKQDVSRFLKEIEAVEKADINKFKVNQALMHKVFGIGTIKEIRTIDSKSRAIVEFDGHGKELDLRVCLENGIISLIKS